MSNSTTRDAPTFPRWSQIAGLAVIAIVGLGIRIWLIGRSSAEMNSDEYFTGLQAMAILEGDRPIIYRGIGYTAVVDSYLLAPFYWFADAPVTLLKLFNAPWWALTTIFSALTARRSISHTGIELNRLHVVVGSLIWITPGALMIVSTRSYEAYGLLLLGIAITQYFAIRSIETAGADRRWSYALGASAGFTFFLHPMTLTAFVPMLIVTTLRGRREVRTYWIPVTIGVVITNLGFLAWNIKNNWLSLAVPPPNDSYTERLPRIFTGLIPRAIGLMDTHGDWTLGTFSVVLYVVILASAGVGIVTMLRHGWQGAVIAIPALLVWPMLAGLSSTWFVADGRYAIVGFTQLVIVTVFGLHEIARRLQSLTERDIIGRTAAALPAAFAVVWIVAGGIFWLRANAGPAVDDPNARMRAVTELLKSENVNYAAGNYWHVQPVEYLSGGDIHVAVAGHPWGAYLDWRPELPWAVLFPARQPEVAAQPDNEVAYIFDASDEQIGTLRMAPEAYTRHQIGSSIVYIPNR
jgi:hypothetical protein